MKTCFCAVRYLPILLLITSCGMSIPDTDFEPPQLAFHISGPGVADTIDRAEQPKSMYYRLKPGGTYRFTLTSSDAGGLSAVTLQLPEEITFRNVRTQEDVPVMPLPVTGHQGEHIMLARFAGIRETSVGNVVMTGEFVVPATHTAFSMEAFATDFGGRSGPGNTTSYVVEAEVGSPAGKFGIGNKGLFSSATE